MPRDNVKKGSVLTYFIRQLVEKLRFIFKLVTLLVKFFLIKIGGITIFLIGRFFYVFYGVTKAAYQFNWHNLFKNTAIQLTDIVNLFYRSLTRLVSFLKIQTSDFNRFLVLRLKSTIPKTYPLFIRPKRIINTSLLHQMKKTVLRKVPKGLRVLVVFSLIFITFFIYTFLTIKAANQLPNPNRLISKDTPLTTEFYDRNGHLLYRLYEGRNRTLVKLSDLPPHLLQATIAIEDKNFYQHNGVDPMAMFRALYHNLKNGKLEGASTITQQLIKNSLLSPEKTYSRKLKEIILAFWSERIYSKNEILQMYLNEAPYGGPAWGVEAAAQTYFGKSAKDLDLSESTYLAGLPALPTVFSPYGTNPDLGKVRQKEVLRRMVEEGFITSSQADEAFNKQLHFNPPINNIYAPHFVMYVKDLLSQKYGQRAVSQGGLKISTTLDLNLQQQVEKIVDEEVAKLEGLNVQNGAAMVTDSKSGQILSMIGSRNYFTSGFGNFNVTLALRQPGSSIKPITYAVAFEKGYSPGNSILDAPVTFPDGLLKTYSPVNYDGKFHGPISLRIALGSSYNVPAVKLLSLVGIDNMIQTAQRLGITTLQNPKNYGLSLTLGAGEVKMIDMMTAYGTFSQLGIKRPVTPILKVLDSSGNILEEYQDQPQIVLKPEIAYLITHILADNNARTPAFGPNSLLNIDKEFVAVKTGTSDNKRDNWTFGYTTDFVVGVWVGNNNNSPMDPKLTSGITGATPIWNSITKKLLSQYPSKNFARPENIVDITVDGRKDIAISGLTSKSLVHYKKESDKVVYFDTSSTFVTPLP